MAGPNVVTLDNKENVGEILDGNCDGHLKALMDQEAGFSQEGGR